jgi:Uncharacterised nucleotidyltransferase
VGRFDGPRWPTRAQALLLRAALDEPATALTAWREWLRTEDLDGIDAAGYALLPSVHRNLQRGDADIPEGERLRGVFRRTWYTGQVLTSQASEAIAALEQAGVTTLLLKGAALIALEPDAMSGVRHMADVDVLVPESKLDEAIALLTAAGWQPEFSLRALRSYRHVLHGVSFARAGTSNLDLHWHALEEACQPGADEPFWAASRAVTFGGVETRVLSAEDLLLHVCVHGTRGKPARVIHWVIDALRHIDREGEDLDWDRLVRRARSLHLSLALGESLRYLATEFGAAIPESTLEALERSHHGGAERFDFRAKGAPPTLFWSIAADTTRYLRLSAGTNPLRRTIGFFTYLQHLWVLDSPWRVPLEGARRTWGRARETRFRLWRPLRDGRP